MSIHWQIMFDLWSLSVSQSIRKKTNLIKNIFEDMLFFHISNNLIYWNIFSLKLLDGFRQRNLSEIMKLQKKVLSYLFSNICWLYLEICVQKEFGMHFWQKMSWKKWNEHLYYFIFMCDSCGIKELGNHKCLRSVW